MNGQRIECPTRLNSGDQIMAGHLTIGFSTHREKVRAHGCCFRRTRGKDAVRRFATDLTHAITSDRPVAAGRMDALIRAGQEFAGHRPLEELFTLILDLAVDSVKAERGVLLTLEGDVACPEGRPGRKLPDQQRGARPRAGGERIDPGQRCSIERSISRRCTAWCNSRFACSWRPRCRQRMSDRPYLRRFTFVHP